MRPPIFIFFIKILMVLEGPLRIYVNFKIDFSFSVKTTIRILIENALNL